jgi:hypothetical protein
MHNETAKLINVLRRIARAAGYANWVKSDADATRFCAKQYNRVLTRLNELEPNIKGLFALLPEDASADVIRMAARDLAAYFDDDFPDSAWGFAWAYRHGKHGRERCRPISVPCDIGIEVHRL